MTTGGYIPEEGERIVCDIEGHVFGCPGMVGGDHELRAPHPTLSPPWGDPDYDPSCGLCRSRIHGRYSVEIDSHPDPDWFEDEEGYVKAPLSYENREGDPAFNGAFDRW